VTITTASGTLCAERAHERPDGLVREADLRVVAIDVAIAERKWRVLFVRLVRRKQVHPGEQALVSGRALQILRHLVDAPLAFGKLHPLVLEAQKTVAEGLKAVRVDEEHRRRVERRRAVAIGAK
jgi:hypothetical protein